MTRRVFNRLLAMRPEELRFRVLCEARKLEGRMRTAAVTSAWRRSSLLYALNAETSAPGWSAVRDALEREDFRAAQVALQQYFTTRASAFPINARELRQLTPLVLRAFPSAREQAVARAEQILRGRYDLLGYRALQLGAEPDWHADPVHGRRSAVVYWADVRFLDPASGDHKIIWELNRHQHWLALGRAYTLSGDRRFYQCFVAQLQSWLRANPPLTGTNWASMLELAFRSLSWLWALEMFADAAHQENEDPWIVDLLLALDRQLTHIEQNLSRYFSPNTHLTGEALALYVAGSALPELAASTRRASVGRDVLIEQASRQIHTDGGHAELSTHYQRYSTDFYLLAARVARRTGDTAAEVFENAARVQARYLRTICDQNGMRPPLGDDDGGQLFPMCGRTSEDCRPTLAAAAALLRDGTLRLGPILEEAYWLCGERATSVPPEAPSPASTAFMASGYYVSRTSRGDHLIFDAGPHGFLNGGHAHSDALALTLSVSGRPLLIDPGTATYTMNEELRDRFRGTMMHNTVVLDGRAQSTPRGAFHWTSPATAEARIWRTAAGGDYVEGTHAAYLPYRHTRGVLSIHGIGWWVVDHILGPSTPVAFDGFWHLHPGWHVTSVGPYAGLLTQGPDALTFASSAPLTLLTPGASPLAFYSPDYGVVGPAPTVQSSTTVTPPATIATFIPATSEITGNVSAEPVPIERRPAGWHTAAFRLRWNDGLMWLLAAVELDGVAPCEDSVPPARWGTAAIQTDARLALLIEHGGRTSEALLVNGAELHAGSAIVSLPNRHSIVRVGQVAPAVQQPRGFAGCGSDSGRRTRDCGRGIQDQGPGSRD
jgi:heparinase II/III-like protein